MSGWTGTDRDGGRAGERPDSEGGEIGYLLPADGSCRATVETDPEGQFELLTSLPGSHGPPQQIHFRVSAPGYKPVTTTMYLKDDPQLKTMARAKFDHIVKDRRVVDVEGRAQGSDYAASAPGAYNATFDMTLRPGDLSHLPPLLLHARSSFLL